VQDAPRSLVASDAMVEAIAGSLEAVLGLTRIRGEVSVGLRDQDAGCVTWLMSWRPTASPSGGCAGAP
jgi:hypothetical protein